MLIRRDYHPSRWHTGEAAENFQSDFRAGRLTAETLLSQYCTLVYSKNGSYEETARRTGLDRRTVKSKIDAGFLARLQREA